MKKIYLGFLLILYLTTISAQGPEFIWAKSMGADGAELGSDIVLDDFGNVYTTGYFYTSGDYDPSDSTFILNSNGNKDIFIQKLDVNGNFHWAKSIGGSLADRGVSISIDALGNVYVTGNYYGTVDFDPGTAVFDLTATNGFSEIFILKLSSAGNFIWAKSIGGDKYDLATSISARATGFVYIGGRYYNTVDFDPGVGAFELTSTGGYNDFILKLDTSGNFIWATSIGASLGGRIELDNSGNVFHIGSYQDTVDFDPGAGVFNMISEGSYDVFIQKLDASGNFIWAMSIGGPLYDYGHKISIDDSGNLYIVGNFKDTVDFDPDAGIFNLIAPGDNNYFIQKLDGNGSHIGLRPSAVTHILELVLL